MAKKSEAIDILKLYCQSDYNAWNTFLARSLISKDVAGLVDVYRRLQMGMDNLVQQRLNTDQISQLFLRLQRSIENTLRDIHRIQNPNPLFSNSDKALYKDHITDKREKQNNLEQFLKRARY